MADSIISDEEFLTLPVYRERIADLDIDQDSKDCFERESVTHLGELVLYTAHELEAELGMGEESIERVGKALAAKKLGLSMTVADHEQQALFLQLLPLIKGSGREITARMEPLRGKMALRAAAKFPALEKA